MSAPYGPTPKALRRCRCRTGPRSPVSSAGKRLQHVGGVAGRLDPAHRSPDLPLTVDHERRAVDAQVLLAVPAALAPDAVILRDAVIRVREQRERQLELRLELLVRADVVGADAEHHGAAVAKNVVRVSELARLDSATGRVVLRIEVENHCLPAEIGQLHGLAALALQLEVRGR